MKKILLIIEDEEIIRGNMYDMLSMYDYDVHTANNGLEGLRMAQDIIPDIMISDIKMPVMDGHELLQQVREIPALHNMPFIFISANTEPDDVQKSMSMGADDYLTKPFKAKELLASIAARLKKGDK